MQPCIIILAIKPPDLVKIFLIIIFVELSRTLTHHFEKIRIYIGVIVVKIFIVVKVAGHIVIIAEPE